MLIELEPYDGDNYASRGWVTGGVNDFLREAYRWEQRHAWCRRGTDHMTVDQHDHTDGVRVLWLYCECGRRRLVLGPINGRAMRPTIPRLQ